MANSVNTRNVILDMLMEINEKNQYSHIIIRNALKKYQYLTHEDRAFISRVVLGSVERKITLDYIIDQFSKVKTSKLKPIIRNILRMSIYQMIYMDGSKDFATCNEAVKLASKRGFASLKGFVNGVLRNIARNVDNIEYPTREKDPVLYLAVKYSVPEWIIVKWLAVYDFETVEKIIQAQYMERPLTIRCNQDKITTEELVQELQSQGITVKISPYLDYALEISGYDYLDKIEAFQKGLFFIQDVSSMLVGEIANPQKDAYIIDVCAAPGGKSLHLAQLLKETGKIEARDLSEPKVEMIQDNIDRLEFKNIQAVKMDARILDQESIEKADIVIADLPCSGLGIINKKPDIKYQVSLEKCVDLVLLQREILSIAQQYVKPGGTLIYSTCTVNQEENYENREWFLKQFPAFQPSGFKQILPSELQGTHTQEGYLELLPGILPGNVTNKEPNYNFDGFFISKFERC